MEIEGSVALVTGANRGIGKAFADELLARGATKVYAAVRDVTTVTDPRLTPVALDVTDPAAVTEAAAEFTDVTIVVNNAGIASSNLALSAPLDVARGELEVNYFGLMAMTQAFAPVVAANGGGAFVNMLSVASWVAYPVTTTYGASKAAAWSYTNAARQQLKAQGTEVVAVHVGPVDTDMQAGSDIAKTPPADVARAALDALEAGRPEAVVDEISSSVKAALHDDQTLLYPAIEAQFAAQLAG
ncbi:MULTISPECIES: SDR family oxidoreductase [unclassified Streptomyces]|uniref:SDR family oxidoreductase n=1 Tax=unclassified Streptomyces TaxID=2593676 RepID=UPI000DD9E575|nr:MULTISPECIES: SDR family oxidoreductase [unclassified Streptomyces]QZZ25519.1 SDR family oxidoreductase [Streptomyces sp. ST1015]